MASYRITKCSYSDLSRACVRLRRHTLISMMWYRNGESIEVCLSAGYGGMVRRRKHLSSGDGNLGLSSVDSEDGGPCLERDV